MIKYLLCNHFVSEWNLYIINSIFIEGIKAIFKNPIQIFCNGIFFNEFTLLSYYHELHAQDNFYTRCGNLNETVKYF